MAPADPCYHGSPGTAIAEPPLAAAHRPDGTDRAPLTRDYRMLHRRGGSGGSARSPCGRGVGPWACGRWAAAGRRPCLPLAPRRPWACGRWPLVRRRPLAPRRPPVGRRPGLGPPVGRRQLEARETLAQGSGGRRGSPQWSAAGVRRIGRGVAGPDPAPRPEREPPAPGPGHPGPAGPARGHATARTSEATPMCTGARPIGQLTVQPR